MFPTSDLCLPTQNIATSRSLSSTNRLRTRLATYRERHSATLPKYVETVTQMEIIQAKQSKHLHKRILEPNPKKGEKKALSTYEAKLNNIVMKTPPYVQTNQPTMNPKLLRASSTDGNRSVRDMINLCAPNTSQRVKQEGTNNEHYWQAIPEVKVQDEVKASLKYEDTPGEFELDGIDAKGLLELMDDLPNNFIDTFNFAEKKFAENMNSMNVEHQKEEEYSQHSPVSHIGPSTVTSRLSEEYFTRMNQHTPQEKPAVHSETKAGWTNATQGYGYDKNIYGSDQEVRQQYGPSYDHIGRTVPQMGQDSRMMEQQYRTMRRYPNHTGSQEYWQTSAQWGGSTPAQPYWQQGSNLGQSNVPFGMIQPFQATQQYPQHDVPGWGNAQVTQHWTSWQGS